MICSNTLVLNRWVDSTRAFENNVSVKALKDCIDENISQKKLLIFPYNMYFNPEAEEYEDSFIPRVSKNIEFSNESEEDGYDFSKERLFFDKGDRVYALGRRIWFL